MDNFKFSEEENVRNSEILTYLRKQKKIPFFDKISEEIGYKKGYISKLANSYTEQKVTVLFTLGLELLYNIPRDIFFNKDIVDRDDLVLFINSFNEKNQINTLKQKNNCFEYTYIYTLSNNSEIKRYSLSYKDDLIQVKSNNEIQYTGYIFDKFQAEMVLILNNLKRRTTSTIILERQDILNRVAPISITSKKLKGDQKRILYIGLISKYKISDENIISILSDNENIVDKDMRLTISKRIEDYLINECV